MPKDNYCDRNSPVTYGLAQEPIYGKGVKITPRIPGKQTTPYERQYPACKNKQGILSYLLYKTYLAGGLPEKSASTALALAR